MNNIENPTEVRKISIENAITIEAIARELFNDLNEDRQYNVSKTGDGNVYVFDVQKRRSSFLKLVSFHCQLKLYQHENECVFECVNLDLESKILKYSKSFLIGGSLCMLNTKGKLDEIQDFPNKIEQMIKSIIAKR